MNYRIELPAAWASLATVFPSHSRQRRLRPDQRPPIPGLKGKHFQSCRTSLSCSINVTLSALVVRYFWAAGGRKGDYKSKERNPLSVLKPQTPTTCCLVEYFTGSFLTPQTCFQVKADFWISEISMRLFHVTPQNCELN